MNQEDFENMIRRSGGDPAQLPSDAEIVQHMEDLSAEARNSHVQTQFFPFIVFSGILRQYARIYRATMEAGVSLQGSGGLHDLVVEGHDGKYLGEKWAMLIGPLHHEKYQFAIEFLKASEFCHDPAAAIAVLLLEQEVEYHNQFFILR